MKISISIDDDLLKRTDEFAKKHFFSRSGLIGLALDQYMTSVEMRPQVEDMLKNLSEILDTGNYDPAQLEALEQKANNLNSKIK